MIDTLYDILPAALPDEELDCWLREHGSLREGDVLRDEDVPREVVKWLRRHLDQDGEREFPESREVRAEVEDVKVVESHSG